MVRKNNQGGHQQLMGFGVSGTPSNYTWLDPGLRIEAQENPKAEVALFTPRHGHCDFTYYRCAPGAVCAASLNLEAGAGGQHLHLYLKIHDSTGAARQENLLGEWPLKPGANQIEAQAKLPETLEENTLYADRQADTMLHVMLEARFSKLSIPVIVRAMLLRHQPANTQVAAPRLLLNGQASPASPAPGKWRPMPAPEAARSYCELTAESPARCSWILRRTAVDWQVRNAPVADHESFLEVGPLRNPWMPQPEILLAPFGGPDPLFVERLAGVNRARVYPLNRGNAALRIDLIDAQPDCEIVVRYTAAPKKNPGCYG